MTPREFYRLRVDECEAEAGRADLSNVRDRSLRARDAWQALLDKADHSAAAGAANEKSRTERG